MAKPITIETDRGTWVVRAGGAIVGESSSVLVLREEGYDPVAYFPREDIAMRLLDRTRTVTECPHKGSASYFSIETHDTKLTDAAWSYEAPFDDMSRIAGHIAFDTDAVVVEKI